MPALWLKRVRIIHLIRRNALDVVLSKEAGAARQGGSTRATARTSSGCASISTRQRCCAG